MPSFKVEDLNRLVFDERRLVQLETLRGCTMLVPKRSGSDRIEHSHANVYGTRRSRRAANADNRTGDGAAQGRGARALQSGARTTEQSERVPSALVRDFGPDLKRIGLTNSLSLAINLLKEEGKLHQSESQEKTGFNRVFVGADLELLPKPIHSICASRKHALSLRHSISERSRPHA